jgi:hypothetical protein
MKLSSQKTKPSQKAGEFFSKFFWIYDTNISQDVRIHQIKNAIKYIVISYDPI